VLSMGDSVEQPLHLAAAANEVCIVVVLLWNGNILSFLVPERKQGTIIFVGVFLFVLFLRCFPLPLLSLHLLYYILIITYMIT
jgi:hypothetical protein